MGEEEEEEEKGLEESGMNRKDGVWCTVSLPMRDVLAISF